MPTLEYRDICLPTNATGRDRAPSTPPNEESPRMEPMLLPDDPGPQLLVWVFSRDVVTLLGLGWTRAEIGNTYAVS